MKTLPKFLAVVTAFLAIATAPAILGAQDDLALPAAQKSGGMPLMEALAKRSTARTFDPARDLSKQQLSNLLWAAWGVNRPDGKRTAPSAHNRREMDVYVLLKQGAYRYDAEAHALVAVAAGKDLRELGGVQSFVKDAPATIVLVADFDKLSQTEDAAKREISSANAGFIAQNAQLYCASEGLSSGVRMLIDREKLGSALSLKKTRWIVLAVSVGYPAK